MHNGSFKSKVSDFIKIIDARIHAVFNRDFFSVYEGIIEIVNDSQSTLSISVPDLNNATFENCRVVTPALSESSKLIPTFNVGTHVLIMFLGFSISTPIVIGQLSPINTIHSPLNSTSIDIVNGSGAISIDSAGNISISGANIILTGSTITANGEDLTDDDIGAL